MPRIDQEYGDFSKFEAIHKAQTDIQAILNTSQLSMSMDTKVERVSQILEDTHEAIKDDYQAYGVFDKAFTLNNTFQKWIANLAPGSQKMFKKFMSSMLPPIDNHTLIHVADLGYRSQNFQDVSKSEWLDVQKDAHLSPLQMKSAELVEELIRQERASISMAATTPSTVFEYLNDTLVSKSDKKILTDYLSMLSEQRAAYDNLKLHEVLIPKEKPLASVVAEISQMYQSPNYKTYQDTVEDLMPMLSKIETILNKYKHINQVPLFTTITQQIAIPSSYPGIFKKLIENRDLNSTERDSLDQSLLVAQKRKASADAIYEFNGLMNPLGDSREQLPVREKAVMRALLLSSKTTLEQDVYNQHNRGVLIEHMLAEAFPSTFEIVDRGIKVKGTNANAIYSALGGKPPSGASLDPHLFSPEKLGQLSRELPICAVLKATKPLDDHFTLLDKVKAYQEVIKLAKEGKIKISGESPIEQARQIAQKNMDIVKDRIKRFPAEDTPALQNEMTVIYQTIHGGKMTHSVMGKYSPVETQYKEFKKREYGLGKGSSDVVREAEYEPLVSGQHSKLEVDVEEKLDNPTSSMSSLSSHASLEEQDVDMDDDVVHSPVPSISNVSPHVSVKMNVLPLEEALHTDSVPNVSHKSHKETPHVSVKMEELLRQEADMVDEELPLSTKSKPDLVEEHDALEEGSVSIKSRQSDGVTLEEFEEIVNQRALDSRRNSVSHDDEPEIPSHTQERKNLLASIVGHGIGQLKKTPPKETKEKTVVDLALDNRKSLMASIQSRPKSTVDSAEDMEEKIAKGKAPKKLSPLEERMKNIRFAVDGEESDFDDDNDSVASTPRNK